jgi:hypothetical protein
MSEGKPSNLPLIAMTMVNMLWAAAASVYLYKGVIFGWEIDRHHGIPLNQLGAIAAPLVITIAMLSATILFWFNGQRRVSYALTAAMLIAAVAVFTLFRAPAR